MTLTLRDGTTLQVAERAVAAVAGRAGGATVTMDDGTEHHVLESADEVALRVRAATEAAPGMLVRG